MWLTLISVCSSVAFPAMYCCRRVSCILHQTHHPTTPTHGPPQSTHVVHIWIARPCHTLHILMHRLNSSAGIITSRKLLDCWHLPSSHSCNDGCIYTVYCAKRHTNILWKHTAYTHNPCIEQRLRNTDSYYITHQLEERFQCRRHLWCEKGSCPAGCCPVFRNETPRLWLSTESIVMKCNELQVQLQTTAGMHLIAHLQERAYGHSNRRCQVR